MKPESIKALLASPQGKELQQFLQSEVSRLQQIPAKLPSSNEAIALEIAARQRAGEVLNEILKPFLFPDGTTAPGIKKDEYLT